MRCNQRLALRRESSRPAFAQSPSRIEPGRRAARRDPRRRIRYSWFVEGNRDKRSRQSQSSCLLHQLNKNLLERGSPHFKLQDWRLSRDLSELAEQGSFL